MGCSGDQVVNMHTQRDLVQPFFPSWTEAPALLYDARDSPLLCILMQKW